MNKIIYIKVFNDILDQFFDYTETTFPFFKSDIYLTRCTTDFVRRSNPRLVVEEFMQYVEPYSKYIFECDEYFFLNFEKNITLTNDNILFGMKLKKLWLQNDITTEQKAVIFLLFQKLLKAGAKCL